MQKIIAEDNLQVILTFPVHIEARDEAVLDLESGSEVVVRDNASVICESDTEVEARDFAVIKAHEECNLITRNSCNIITGGYSTIFAGNRCDISTGTHCNIDAKDNANILCKYECTINAGDHADVITGHSSVYVGKGSMVIMTCGHVEAGVGSNIVIDDGRTMFTTFLLSPHTLLRCAYIDVDLKDVQPVRVEHNELMKAYEKLLNFLLGD